MQVSDSPRDNRQGRPVGANALAARKTLENLKAAHISAGTFNSFQLSPTEVQRECPQVKWHTIKRLASELGFSLNSDSPAKKIGRKAEAILVPLKKKLISEGKWNSYKLSASDFVQPAKGIGWHAIRAAGRRLGFQLISRDDEECRKRFTGRPRTGPGQKIIDYLTKLKERLVRDGTWEGFKLSPSEVRQTEKYVTRETIKKYAIALGFRCMTKTDPEFLEQRSRQMKAYYSKPEQVARLRQASKTYHNRPEVKERFRKQARAWWEDPEYREMITAGLKGPRKRAPISVVNGSPNSDAVRVSSIEAHPVQRRKPKKPKSPLRKPAVGTIEPRIRKLKAKLLRLKRSLLANGAWEEFKFSPADFHRIFSQVSEPTINRHAKLIGFRIMKPSDPESRTRASQRSLKYFEDPRNRAHSSRVHRVAGADPALRRLRRINALLFWARPENLQKMSERMREQWKDPEFRTKTTKSITRALRIFHRGAESAESPRRRWPIMFDGETRRNYIRDPNSRSPVEILIEQDTPNSALPSITELTDGLAKLRQEDSLAYSALILNHRDLLATNDGLLTSAEVKELVRHVDDLEGLAARGRSKLQAIMAS